MSDTYLRMEDTFSTCVSCDYPGPTSACPYHGTGRRMIFVEDLGLVEATPEMMKYTAQKHRESINQLNEKTE